MKCDMTHSSKDPAHKRRNILLDRNTYTNHIVSTE